MECLYDNCNILASYGLNDKIKKYCKRHKTDDMFYLSKYCKFENCLTIASFGYINNKIKELCACKTHKTKDMKALSQLCLEELCSNRARYNYINEIGCRYCNLHKKENMIDKNKKICLESNCIDYATHNYKENKNTLYCINHKKENMIDKRQKICKFENCLIQAYYGTKNDKQQYCVNHKLENMGNYNSIKCQSCNLFEIKKSRNILCKYCNPNKSKKTKEEKFYKYLIDAKLNESIYYKFIYNKSIGFECGNYRPDFKFDCNTYFVIIEIDENQHKQYDNNCELIRMNNIYLANGLPTLFIRFNPDSFICNKNKIQISLIDKYNNFINELSNYLFNNYKFQSDKGIDIIYYYYDCKCILNCNYKHTKELDFANLSN